MKYMAKLLPASKRALALTVISTIALIALLGVLTHEATKAEVTVTGNGETTQIRTHVDTVGELMKSLDIEISQHDTLSHPETAQLENGMEIKYFIASPVEVVIDGVHKDYHTTKKSVGSFFKEQKLSFKKQDEISHKMDAPIKAGMKIEIATALQVTINDGGKEKKVWTTAENVEELLKEQGIKLNELDELKPGKTKELTAKTHVTITRVEKVTDVVEEPTDFSVVTKKDSSLPKGEKRVVSEGEEGLVTKKYEITMKNGEEVSRKLIEEKTEKDSEKKIVAIGTKEPEKERKIVAVSNTSGGTSNNDAPSRGESHASKTLHMSATAYTANCAGCSGITATGINLKANPNAKVIAVDPNVIPLGSRVWVEGYGYAIAGDTGGAINGNKIDLFMSSQSKAESFGRRTVEVRIIEN
ncbi:G5 and 3D domain-containing protein [Thalassobacillus pellis]|uniref:G5 and 3D domain-containing protein n=1 Tax=Thalassobacillus pellis TaxID=748008 RepID=UPI001961B980|nr:G5 and 3D domain-containing protein [Thalassobacillus pellis]MBM7555170.1 uncharacterized protein YabE (DUF348 family)/3D (Asp-Asp-Asp) domain-containing protein [Thalassobacillus pellis]